MIKRTGNLKRFVLALPAKKRTAQPGESRDAKKGQSLATGATGIWMKESCH